MRTFLANLKHDIRNGKTVEIGSGLFWPDECQHVVNTIEALTVTLSRCIAVMEHRCPETSPLPDARAALQLAQED